MDITFLDVFIIIIIIVIIVLYIKKYYGEVAYVKSDVDNRSYLVKKLPNSKEAANKLAKLNEKITILIKHLLSKYPDNEDIKRLYQNYNVENLSEGTSSEGYTSYSVNKGERIIVCLRQKELNEFSDDNVVMYVVIHELAHCAITEIGHTQYFWKTFKWFLEEAVSIGIYTKVDYKKNPQPYCGIRLTTSVI